MKTIKLNSIDEFDEEVRSLREFRLQKQKHRHAVVSSLLFRGQCNSSWGLETTLEREFGLPISLKQYHRYLLRIKPAVESYTDRKWEVDPDEKFSNDYIGNLPAYPFMVYARHHGFPSPLLDWTRSPYIALFFAFRNAKNSENVAIYAYIERPEGGKASSLNAPHIVGQGPYVTTHPMHFTQQTEYTICIRQSEDVWTYASHDSCLDRADDSQDFVRKIIMSGSMSEEVLMRLDSMNINAYTLFGNEEGLLDMLAVREMLGANLERHRRLL